MRIYHKTGFEMECEFAPWTSDADRFLNELNSKSSYSEWPKNTPNYWALPPMADAARWTYRNDWFARPELQSAFKAKYGRELAPLRTYDELKDIAEFFQCREIDGKKVYSACILTEQGSEGIAMSARFEHVGDQDHLHIRLADHDFVTLSDPDSGLALGTTSLTSIS